MVKCLILVFAAALCLANAKIERPCRLNDATTNKCIQDNFRANSRCSPRITGAVPSIYKIKTYKFRTPYFRSSYIDNNLIIRNHDQCRVVEFFFNTDTDKAVLALECYNLNFESDRTVIQHESLKEDSIYSYHINGTYPTLRFTTTINHADALSICDELTHTEIVELPIFHIDPKDQPTQQFLTRELSELYIYERETFAYRGQELFTLWVQSVICDFGCLIY